MRITLLKMLYTLLLLCSSSTVFSSPPVPQWGFYSHRKINRQAVFTLPPEMMVFFKKNIEYLSIHAVDPDMRRYASPHEAVRHYIDLDHYGKAPYHEVPRNWTDALTKFSEYYFINARNDTLPMLMEPVSYEKELVRFNPKLTGGDTIMVPTTEFRRFFSRNILPQYYEENWVIHPDSLKKLMGVTDIKAVSAFAVDRFSEHGILPYNLERMLERLTDAFRQKNAQSILRHAADIGHYIGDAHVPLHTTKNYNGQLTNQNGIHAFWETRLPELYADWAYDFWVGKAQLIEHPNDYFWNIVLKSNSYVDSVLLIEKSLTKLVDSDQKFCNEMRGDMLIVTQCEEFARLYHERLGGMVEERMRSSIHSLGSIWYTAWVMAGQPDLRNLALGIEDPEQAELEKAFKSGNQKGRKHEGDGGN